MQNEMMGGTSVLISSVVSEVYGGQMSGPS